MNLDKRSLFISACFVASIALGFVLIPESSIKGQLVFIISFAVGILLFWFTRPKISAQEKEIRTKIDQLKSKGQDLALEHEADFNEQDLKELYSRKRLLIFSYIGGTLLVSAILIITIQFIKTIENKIFWQSIVLVVVMGGLSWLFFRDIQKLEYHIRTGKKTIVRGIITNKRIEGDETNTYFLEIDSLSVYVKKKIYDKYKVGDGIEIHIFKPRHNMLLYEAKIESMNLT
ncbi:MAG: hypothetical protein JNM78_20350 [Cyclobacteriaceae bacterium]|nr:hypothetical protein [Cyclobacteriaceae bacterium]